MNDLCAILGHSPGMFGICNVCGVQTFVMPAPIRWVSREEMEKTYPKPADSPDQEGADRG